MKIQNPAFNATMNYQIKKVSLTDSKKYLKLLKPVHDLRTQYHKNVRVASGQRSQARESRIVWWLAPICTWIFKITPVSLRMSLITLLDRIFRRNFLIFQPSLCLQLQAPLTLTSVSILLITLTWISHWIRHSNFHLKFLRVKWGISSHEVTLTFDKWSIKRDLTITRVTWVTS